MLSILIVEDETDLLELYSDLLSKNQRQIETCDSGEKALELIKIKNYDIVISDKKMGQVSGLEILKQVETRSNV